MNKSVWISALVFSVCLNGIFLLGGFTRPISVYAGGAKDEKPEHAERPDAIETLARLSTEQQQQLYALRMAVEQIGTQQATSGARPSNAPVFSSVGALLRSVPQQVILSKYDTELTDAASSQWMDRNTRGRTIRADLVVATIKLDRQTDEIVLTALPFIEPYGATHVEATVECRFAPGELNRLAHLREGMRVRVRGVIDQSFFVRPGDSEAHAMKVYIKYTRLADEASPVAFGS